ncbi:MAG: hypothetical protein GXO85_05530, partial [Chlorobi bacterium]|nr:hypothetical protein [Chlorobiota bacterium]
ILPLEPLALPVKVKNNSFWRLDYTSLTCRVEYKINGQWGRENYQFAPLPTIDPNCTNDHVFEGYGITEIPSAGRIDVTFRYVYSLFNIDYDITQSFILVQNVNGDIR